MLVLMDGLLKYLSLLQYLSLLNILFYQSNIFGIGSLICFGRICLLIVFSIGVVYGTRLEVCRCVGFALLIAMLFAGFDFSRVCVRFFGDLIWRTHEIDNDSSFISTIWISFTNCSWRLRFWTLCIYLFAARGVFIWWDFLFKIKL